METILLVLLIILIILVFSLLILFLFKKSKVKVEGVDKRDLDILQANLSSENTKSSSDLRDYINSLNNTSNEKLSKFELDLKEAIARNLQKNTEDLSGVEKQVKNWILSQTQITQAKIDSSSIEVRNLLSQVKEQSAPIADVKEKVFKLDNLLSQNNKAGKSGEYLLERIFENFTGINKNTNLLFERQYTLKKIEDGKKLIVDLFIKGNGDKFVNIPVDAKFPFNAFLGLFEYDENTENYKNRVKQFKDDVKKRVQETSKYVSDEDGTVYAVMFVPSEGIFSFINANPDLIEFGFNKKVIIAGPSTLIAILQSVDKYMELFDNIEKAGKKIEMLDKTIKFIDNYDDEMKKLFKSIENLSQQYNELKIKDNSLRRQYEKLIKEE